MASLIPGFEYGYENFCQSLKHIGKSLLVPEITLNNIYTRLSELFYLAGSVVAPTIAFTGLFFALTYRHNIDKNRLNPQTRDVNPKLMN